MYFAYLGFLLKKKKQSANLPTQKKNKKQKTFHTLQKVQTQTKHVRIMCFRIQEL